MHRATVSDKFDKFGSLTRQSACGTSRSLVDLYIGCKRSPRTAAEAGDPVGKFALTVMWCKDDTLAGRGHAQTAARDEASG